ncbi:ATP-dependent DNA helicase DinG [Oceanospirillaceae bacterium]|nr:ATP-dependent DNA helicase DinG [Oceanospirillaceae bacterium]MDA9279821.1 ATP-dependent DNA helicase DinG [bacterium]MBT4997629.1 ATP-dependent DNA helicase DinG [Oceanospirillaceae bacterium]MBT5630134.1 ATP-dependent DNA helicase DinG [Oceanospirillaceae bacterium]MBT6101022.1 ATP-dependent DNA helicase DinG [Oceanospirillaceae bacterium]
MSDSALVKQDVQQLYRQLVKRLELTPRWGQKQMIATVANHFLAINRGEDGHRIDDNPVCLVEAGTGTGKTLAYMVACLPIAKALDKKLVISTATIALQEQIVQKDLPALKKHGGYAFDFRLAKGRRRYLCVSRLDQALSQNASIDPTQALFEDELALKLDGHQQALYKDMVVQLGSNQWNGDRDAWQEPLAEDHWRPITTDHKGCTNRRCSHFSQCPFFKARDGLEQADCIVTNHDLVLADLALGGGAILPAPEDTIYIFDEGHHLADKTLKQFTHQQGIRQLSRWYGQTRSGVKKFLKEWQGGGKGAQVSQQVQDHIQVLEQQLISLEQFLDQSAFRPEEGYQQQENYRFAQGIVPAELVQMSHDLGLGSARLARDLGALHSLMDDVVKGDQNGLPKDQAESYLAAFGVLQQNAEQQLGLWQAYAKVDREGEVPMARWLQYWQTPERVDLEISASPIMAAELLQENLWQRCFGALLTSATLTALGRFERLITHAGMNPLSTQLAVQSPFDFSKSQICVPKEAIEPGSETVFVEQLIKGLKAQLNKTEASLVLFTSRRVMQLVFEGMGDVWQDLILQQGESSKQRLLDQHKQRVDEKEGSVLFGLASFAEGIDLPGDYLTHVVITRLPFTVPDRPVPSALAEWIEKLGGNSFTELSVPEASIRLVQATGRLLRKEDDKGRITILDKRIISKRYGQQLLQALPPYQRQFG